MNTVQYRNESRSALHAASDSDGVLAIISLAVINIAQLQEVHVGT